MTIERAAPVLQLRRSDQCGSKTLTGSYVAVYEDSDNLPWIFARARIDLTNLGVGDTIWIRLSTKGEDGGAYAVEDELSYTGVQPADSKAIEIDAIPNVYGVKIEMYQSAGDPPFLAIPCEFLVAKR